MGYNKSMRSHNHLNCYSSKIPKEYYSSRKTLKVMVENQLYCMLYKYKKEQEYEGYIYVYSVGLNTEIKRSEYL